MIKIGQRLKEIRLQKELTIEDISAKTKIRPKFITALENGDYEKLPSAAYAQGFLRNYARFLGIAEKEALALFRREFDEDQAYRVLPHSFSKDKEVSFSKFRSRQTIIIVVFIFLALLGYIVFQYRQAIVNPSLLVSLPRESMTILSSGVVVSGKTDPDVTVFVDNYPVSVDSIGNFRKTITVFPGKTTIIIKAVNRFGRQTVTKRQIISKPGS